MAAVEVIPAALVVAANPDGRGTGQQLGQGLSLRLRKVRLGGQVIGPAGVRVPRPALGPDLPGDPDRGGRYPAPVDAVVVAARPGAAARDELAAQPAPPGRRASEAATVHVHGSGQQPHPGQLAGGLIRGDGRPRQVPVAAVAVDLAADQADHVLIAHRAPLRPAEPVGPGGGEGNQLEAGGLVFEEIRTACAQLQLDPDRRPGRVRKTAVPHRRGVLRRPAGQ